MFHTYLSRCISSTLVNGLRWETLGLGLANVKTLRPNINFTKTFRSLTHSFQPKTMKFAFTNVLNCKAKARLLGNTHEFSLFQCRNLCHKWQYPTHLLGLNQTNGCGLHQNISLSFIRFVHSSRTDGLKKQNQTALLYILAVGIAMLGMAYAGVPLYRLFCQATGSGGFTPTVGHDDSKVETMEPVADRLIRVKFNADVASSLQWNFKPQQTEVKVLPGETALAFYTATNPTDKPIIGISTYNVIPFEAGLYFNKIQCFCFEEQRLNPHEQVDMPVFFYIDPEFAEDPKLENTDTITLSYTFFEAKDGLQLPLPGYVNT